MNRTASHKHEKGGMRCPRFDACNAPVCPLDPQWRLAQHLPGESVCLYLRETVKLGGKERIGAAISEQRSSVICAVTPEIVARHCDIRHKLKAASRSGSKLVNMHAVREQLGQTPATALDDESTPTAATPCEGFEHDMEVSP